jgi:hypothetical protein
MFGAPTAALNPEVVVQAVRDGLGGNPSKVTDAPTEADPFALAGEFGVLKRERAPADADPVEHFRSFVYRSEGIHLSKGEARRVQVLWEKAKSGKKKVLNTALLFGLSEFKLSKVFVTPGGKRFRDLFIKHDAGKYWLEVP